MRKGSANTARGARRFVEELVARVRRAGATGELTCGPTRGSGPTKLDRHARPRTGVHWSITMAITHRKSGPSDRRDRRGRLGQTIDYPDGGEAQVAETTITPAEPSLGDRAPRRAPHPPHRSRPSSALARLASPRVHHRPRDDPRRRSTSSTATTPSSSSRSATSKKAPGSSTAHPGKFFANAAWLGCAVLAHNLIRWTARLGDVHPDERLTVARTIRTRSSRCPAGS